jgi:hypothetical protein
MDPFPVAAVDYASGSSLQITGFRLESKNARRRVRLFGGRESILQGIGIPLVYSAKQNVAGGDITYTLGHGLVVGGRVLWLSEQQGGLFSTAQLSLDNLALVPASKSAAADLFWQATTHFSIGAEFGISKFGDGSNRAWHLASLARAVWDSRLIKAHVSYVDEAASYLPIAGYIASTKNVISADASYRVFNRLTLFGASTSQDLTSLQYLPGTSFHGSAKSGGFTLTLPWNANVSAQYSVSSYASSGNATVDLSAEKVQFFSVLASRGFKRHTLHFVGTQLRTTGTPGLQTQSTEGSAGGFQH